MHIRKALEANPKIVIVTVKEKSYLPNYSPGRDGKWSHVVDFWVAPKEGLYEYYKLQEFMLDLIPDLAPTSQENFQKRILDEDSNWPMGFGSLYFDEKIGEERVIRDSILTLRDEDMLNIEGLVDGAIKIHSDKIRECLRRTIVSPFPDERLARDELQGKSRIYSYIKNGQRSIRRRDLERYAMH